MSKRRVHRPNNAIIFLALFIVIGLLLLAKVYREQVLLIPTTGRATSLPLVSTIAPGSAVVGDSITLSLQVDQVRDFMAFSHGFTFDPDILQFEEATLGPFLSENPFSPVEYYPPTQPTAGTLADSWGNRLSPPGVSGSGILVTLRFTALSPGQSSLTPTLLTLYDRYGYDIPAAVEGNEITITPRCIDADGDLFGTGCSAGVDCNDAAAAVHPGAEEICGNAVDEDCNGNDLACPLQNAAPVVSAGTDQTIVFPATASLAGTVVDDGLPIPPALVLTWVKVSGPGSVSFGTANAISTPAQFSIPGLYTLRLSASDGELSAADEILVSVILNQTNQTNQTNQSSNASEPTSAAQIGLTAPQVPLVLNPLLNFSYNLSNTTQLRSCAIMLNAITVQTDMAFTRRFSVPLTQPGGYLWQIYCTTISGRPISLPSFVLYYVKLDEFRTLSEIRAPLTSVPNFQLERIGAGKIQFLQPVDLTAAVDLNAAIAFNRTNISINTSVAPGLNRPARITLYNIPLSYPRILRDGQPCVGCTIESFNRPVLTFQVPGFSTYSVVESTANRTNSTNHTTTNRTTTSCTVSLSSSNSGIQLRESAVLCIGISRWRIEAIGSGATKLIQEAPKTDRLTFTIGAAQEIDTTGDNKADYTLQLLNLGRGVATFRLTTLTKSAPSAAQTPSAAIPPTSTPTTSLVPLAPQLPASSLPQIPPAPPSLASSPPLSTIAPSVQQPSRIPSLLLAATLIIFAVLGIVVVYNRFHSQPEPTKSVPEMNDKLQLELEAIGVAPEEAMRKIRERAQKRKQS